MKDTVCSFHLEDSNGRNEVCLLIHKNVKKKLLAVGFITQFTDTIICFTHIILRFSLLASSQYSNDLCKQRNILKNETYFLTFVQSLLAK